jgi:hypothetical protein
MVRWTISSDERRELGQAAGATSLARSRGALKRTAAAFVAFAGPLDLLTRFARRSSPDLRRRGIIK